MDPNGWDPDLWGHCCLLTGNKWGKMGPNLCSTGLKTLCVISVVVLPLQLKLCSARSANTKSPTSAASAGPTKPPASGGRNAPSSKPPWVGSGAQNLLFYWGFLGFNGFKMIFFFSVKWVASLGTHGSPGGFAEWRRMLARAVGRG